MSEADSPVFDCRCLTVDPKYRPDIIGVAAFIAEELMEHTETVRSRQVKLERRLEKERQRTQKHFSKANNYRQSYQKLFLANQERYDKLANSQNSMASTLSPGYEPDRTILTAAIGDDDEPSSSDSSGSASSLRAALPPKPTGPHCKRLDFRESLVVEIPRKDIPTHSNPITVSGKSTHVYAYVSECRWSTLFDLMLFYSEW